MAQSSAEIEENIKTLGKEIFKSIGDSQPSVFNQGFFHSKLMQWSLSREDFKNSLFHLVDVLPALQSSQAVGKHIIEYLSEPAGKTSRVLKLAINSLKYGKVSAWFANQAVHTGINQMAKVFIAGESPKTALKALKELNQEGIAFTIDLLGEYSLSQTESLEYLDRYIDALETISTAQQQWKSKWQVSENHLGIQRAVNVSVKLSALYSQTSILNLEKSISVLKERFGQIAEKALKLDAGLYLDAEDTGNNPIIYQTFKSVFSEPEFANFQRPGIVVQAYSKDSKDLIYDLLDFAKSKNKQISVRLVKGAYWDQEAANSAQNYWPNPLFQDKAETDKNYEEMSKILLDNHKYFYPAFGSHNIRSLAHACCYAESQGIDKSRFELQMLYGMARPIARAFTKEGYLVRMYVPIGDLIPGMGYFVRRLLENTSNDSFLRHTFYEDFQIEELLKSPNSN